jgi:23S rRNA (adenine2030-N6)-methyltransferase
MNYGHAFHAGNFADVVKHVGMVCLLDRLIGKPTPLCYVETHAGRGIYDLRNEASRRSGEAASGVLRVAGTTPDSGPVRRYLGIVGRVNSFAAVSMYPGSPAIAAALLRAEDRLILCESQAEEARALRQGFRDDARVSVHCRDGYSALRAILPPMPRRGCVLIDPPYESGDDTDRALDAIAEGLKRWPTGIFVLWYPIKQRHDALALRRQLGEMGAAMMALEVCIRPDDNPVRLNGAGLAILRPPWRLEAALRKACTQLADTLCAGRPARAEVISSADRVHNVSASGRSPRRTTAW